LKDKPLRLSVHFYIILPATLMLKLPSRIGVGASSASNTAWCLAPG
jgi:hypothetical protein